MEPVFKQFIAETFNQNGKLVGIDFHYPEDFNFGFDVVDVLAGRYPDDNALVWLSREKEKKVFTYSQMSKLSNRAANLFVGQGIKKGDVVMLILKRHHQFWPIMTALHKIGAIAVPATFLLTEKDLVYRFNTAGVKAVVCTGDGAVADAVDAALAECETVKLRFSANSPPREGWIDYDESVKNESDSFKRPTGADAPLASEIMLMYFTSGTTGYPRIAAHAHTYALGHIITGVHWHGTRPGDLHLTISDTGWGKAVWGKLYGQWLGEVCIFAYDFDKFDAKDILSVLEENKINTFCAPPTIYRFLIQEDLGKYDLSALRYLTTAGEALNPEVFKRIKDATGIEIMEGFGQTETTLTICNLLNSRSVSIGSMGKPSPQYKLLLVDNDGIRVEPGVVGEIAIDTSDGAPVGMFLGYYRDEELTKQVWHDGLYHTGDMAWADENGNYWFVGRTDDLIKSSGYRISPFEIESVLMEHHAVMECAVTGVPDDIRGQIVKATITLAPGYSPTDALADEIQAFVKKLTAPYKYPRIIEFADELPKTISGKIRRAEIRGRDIKTAVAPAKTDVVLEKLQVADFSRLAPLLQLYKNSVMEERLTEQQLAALETAVAADQIEFYIAKRGEELIGMCSVSFLFSTHACDHIGVFDNLYLLEKQQGKGIARRLVNFVRQEMSERGVTSIRVSANRDIEMYVSLGFETELGGVYAFNAMKT